MHQTPREFASLDKAGRRRVVRQSAVYVCIVLAGLAAIYLLAPVGSYQRELILAVWLRLVAAVAIFVAVMALQVRRILRAEVPEAAAVEAVVVGVCVFLVMFSILYLSLSETDPLSFSEPLSRIDALYFTTATFATVGFGDIAAVSQLARAVVTVQMLLDLAVIVVAAKVAFTVARSGFHRPP